MAMDTFSCWRNLFGLGAWLHICLLLITTPQFLVTGLDVNITILHSAVHKGAVCLDGSPPAYNYYEGSENGWIVFLQGGGWCYNLTDCYLRSVSHLGSSHFMTSYTQFSGLLDSDCTSNPHFCNWHKVYLHYCDGSSFFSDLTHPKSNLSFRGARIFNVMMEEMLTKGMGKAHNAIISGTSAGGLATILHCDEFATLFTNGTRVKCIFDSGFFLHGKGRFGDKFRENFFSHVINTTGLANYLPPTCTSKRDFNLCLFPEYLVEEIKTPLFILESAFDRYQLKYLVLGYISCTRNLASCNSTELRIIRAFRNTFINTLIGSKHSSSRGMFVHSCYVHGHIQEAAEWTCLTLANKTIEKAIADWYFDRSYFQEIDTITYDRPQNCTNLFSQCPFIQKSFAPVTHENRLSFLLHLCLVMHIVYMFDNLQLMWSFY